MARILIIDDDAEIVSLLQEILKGEGHDVQSAAEPVEGMRLARKAAPDLIILDYHMPGASGAHLFESLRRNAGTSRVPVLFMSGAALPEQIFSEVADPGSARYLPKPVHVEEFRKNVRELLAAGRQAAG